MSDQLPAPQKQKPLHASLREKSNSDLESLIRSPKDKAEIDAMILEEAAICVDTAKFVENWTPEERARNLDAYRTALREFPFWAVNNAFLKWRAQHSRRPSPAEIGTLANSLMEPVTREIGLRRKEAGLQQEAEAERERQKCSQEAAAAIMDKAGFTPKRIAEVSKRMTPHSLAELDEPIAKSELQERPEFSTHVAKARINNAMAQEARKAAGMPPLVEETAEEDAA